MDSDLAQEAIDAALSRDWLKAIQANKRILAKNPNDVDALNRIARAYAEKGNIKKAKLLSKKVLKIDPLNTIAAKCLDKWENFKRDNNINFSYVSPTTFIEDSTKTKMINLINLGEAKKLASLECGDKVELLANGHRVNVVASNNSHIGRFPDDIAYKFISLMKLGSFYEAVIKSANSKEVKIFVRFKSKNG